MVNICSIEGLYLNKPTGLRTKIVCANLHLCAYWAKSKSSIKFRNPKFSIWM